MYQHHLPCPIAPAEMPFRRVPVLSLPGSTPGSGLSSLLRQRFPRRHSIHRDWITSRATCISPARLGVLCRVGLRGSSCGVSIPPVALLQERYVYPFLPPGFATADVPEPVLFPPSFPRGRIPIPPLPRVSPARWGGEKWEVCTKDGALTVGQRGQRTTPALAYVNSSR